MKKKILVVDDEKDIVELIAYNLEREGFAVRKAYDGEEALEAVRTGKPELVILDLMLPGLPGLEVCRMLRKNPETERLPIIMLTAKGDQIDKIIGLETGADDYITKPFHVKELIARVRAILRRTSERSETDTAEVFTFRSLCVDYGSYEVTVNGEKVQLSPTEMRLLRFLSSHPGRIYSREQLLDHVWRDETFVEPRTVDVHISRLRAVIEQDKDKPQYILTVRGIGYKFTDMK